MPEDQKTITIKLPSQLHQCISELAIQDHRTLSAFIRLLLAQHVQTLDERPPWEDFG